MIAGSIAERDRQRDRDARASKCASVQYSCACDDCATQAHQHHDSPRRIISSRRQSGRRISRRSSLALCGRAQSLAVGSARYPCVSSVCQRCERVPASYHFATKIVLELLLSRWRELAAEKMHHRLIEAYVRRYLDGAEQLRLFDAPATRTSARVAALSDYPSSSRS